MHILGKTLLLSASSSNLLCYHNFSFSCLLPNLIFNRLRGKEKGKIWQFYLISKHECTNSPFKLKALSVIRSIILAWGCIHSDVRYCECSIWLSICCWLFSFFYPLKTWYWVVSNHQNTSSLFYLIIIVQPVGNNGEVYNMHDWHFLDIACRFHQSLVYFLRYFESSITWGERLSKCQVFYGTAFHVSWNFRF